MGRHGYTSQNVLALCDFGMRFTFAVAGWPGSVHDMRVFKDAIDKYSDRFPYPPEGIDLSYDLFFHLHALTLHLAYNCNSVGKFYLVDSGYLNRLGYLASYRDTKYHL
jgi:hypothetical protein